VGLEHADEMPEVRHQRLSMTGRAGRAAVAMTGSDDPGAASVRFAFHHPAHLGH
jgi:hypothetical protein